MCVICMICKPRDLLYFIIYTASSNISLVTCIKELSFLLPIGLEMTKKFKISSQHFL